MTLWQDKTQNKTYGQIYKLSFGLSLLFLLSLLSACASYITVEGKIAVKGNEPFTFLSISNDEFEYQLTGELEKQIRNKYQGQIVTLKGLLIKTNSFNRRQLNVSAIVSVKRQ